MTDRRCGECSLCCKLVPVPQLGKKAGQRCKHQRHTGCAIYDKRPHSCVLWSCRWLTREDTADMQRPDRSGCVIDMMPDIVRVEDAKSGDVKIIEVVQIWVDPKRRDAWRSPDVLAYIERRAAEGRPTLIRYSATDGVTVLAPALTADRKWHEHAARNNPELLVERKKRYGY